MDQDDRTKDQNLDEEMERDTEIRRDTQVRSALGLPPTDKDVETLDRDAEAAFKGEAGGDSATDTDRDDEKISER